MSSRQNGPKKGPCTTLGVNVAIEKMTNCKKSDDTYWKKIYRAQSLKCHPDKNPDTKVQANNLQTKLNIHKTKMEDKCRKKKASRSHPSHPYAGSSKTGSFKTGSSKTGSSKQDSVGTTRLHTAAYKGQVEQVKSLLKMYPEGAKQLNHFSRLPLHEAALAGYLEIVNLLLKAYPEGAKQLDQFIRLPLHYAAKATWIKLRKQQYFDIINVLLIAYPDGAKKKDKYSKFPFEYASQKGQSSCARHLGTEKDTCMGDLLRKAYQN